jgi:hypothetical protein
MRAESRTRRWGRAAIPLLLVPFLLAAADPTGDAAACGGNRDGQPPDLVEARGEIAEFGTSAWWTLTFAQDLTLPDAQGHPFRVDVVIHDPGAPVFDVGFYRHVNRIVRFDATQDPGLQILLLPEGASNVFSAPAIEGRTMLIRVPGRILSDDEDETGTSPGLGRLRWNVIVRDEDTCDVLGNGLPIERFVRAAPEEPPVALPVQPGNGGSGWARVAIIVAIAGVAGAAVGATTYVRRSRSR